MKIFHVENNREVVYVQLQDMAYLNHETDIAIPTSIFTKVFNNSITKIDASNRFNFIKFDKPEDVDFFKKWKFIIDYNQYKEMNHDQVAEEVEKLVEKSNKIVEKWNNMSVEERKEHKEIYDEYHHIFYMVQFLTELYAVKQGITTMPFPRFVKNPKVN